MFPQYEPWKISFPAVQPDMNNYRRLPEAKRPSDDHGMDVTGVLGEIKGFDMGAIPEWLRRKDVATQ